MRVPFTPPFISSVPFVVPLFNMTVSFTFPMTALIQAHGQMTRQAGTEDARKLNNSYLKRVVQDPVVKFCIYLVFDRMIVK